MVIHVENAGPAVARSVSVSWRLASVELPNGHLAEPVMSVGFRRTIVPSQEKTLDQLAAQGVPVEIDLSWRDGRRSVQKQAVKTSARDVKAAYDESRALPRPSQLEVLGQVRDEIKRIADKRDR